MALTSDSTGALEGQLRESYGRVVYAHKTHEKCADLLLARLGRIKWLQIILSAVTTVGFVGAFFHKEVAASIGVVISTVLLAVNSYVKDYPLGEIGEKHRRAARDIWLVREKYLSLIADLRVGLLAIEEIQLKRDALLEELHDIYVGAPSTNYKAYREAQQALQKMEDMTFSDEEIDKFLPAQLRLVGSCRLQVQTASLNS